MQKLSRKFIFLILVGILIRALAISWAFGYRENTDILRWKDWGSIAYLHSLADTYKPDYASKPKVEFDTYDCSWECKACGRLNLSGDGLIEKIDALGNEHSFYCRGGEERARIEALPDGFDSGKLEEL